MNGHMEPSLTGYYQYTKKDYFGKILVLNESS